MKKNEGGVIINIAIVSIILLVVGSIVFSYLGPITERGGKPLNFEPKYFKENAIYKIVSFGTLIQVVETNQAVQNPRVFWIMNQKIDPAKLSHGNKFSIRREISSGEYFIDFLEINESVEFEKNK